MVFPDSKTVEIWTVMPGWISMKLYLFSSVLN